MLAAAGVPPPRAWALATGGQSAVWTTGDATAVAVDVGAVLAVAERTGAPVAPTLRALAGALRRAAESERAVRVALAGPRTSARVVLALPALGLLLGAMWGAPAVETLVATPLGWGCSVIALGLVTAARMWTARLVRSATPEPGIPGLLLDAWAVAVSGGGSWDDGVRIVGDAVPDRRMRERERVRVRETLALARDAGVPAAALLRACAEDERAETAAEQLVAAERLGVRLVLPLGVCVLPAFVLVGVVPVVVGVLSSTVGVGA